MYDGAIEERWGRLANLLALIANCHSTKKKKFKPKDFMPKDSAPIEIESMGDLKKQFEGFKGRRRNRRKQEGVTYA